MTPFIWTSAGAAQRSSAQWVSAQIKLLRRPGWLVVVWCRHLTGSTYLQYSTVQYSAVRYSTVQPQVIVLPSLRWESLQLHKFVYGVLLFTIFILTTLSNTHRWKISVTICNRLDIFISTYMFDDLSTTNYKLVCVCEYLSKIIMMVTIKTLIKLNRYLTT